MNLLKSGVSFEVGLERKVSGYTCNLEQGTVQLLLWIEARKSTDSSGFCP